MRAIGIPLLFVSASSLFGCGARVVVDLGPAESVGGMGGSAVSSSSGAVDAGPDAPAPLAPVYANGANTLYRFDPSVSAVSVVGTLAGCMDILDIAVDARETIFAITPDGLFRVDPSSATCTFVGNGGSFTSSLAFVPAGVLDSDKEVLVGYDSGVYVQIDDATGAVTPIGALGGRYGSSGDVVVAPNGDVLLTVTGPGCNDCLARIDPKTGAVGTLIGNLGYGSVWGLARSGDAVYGFTDSGQVIQIDVTSGHALAVPLSSTPPRLSFSGAGSAAPSNP